MTQQLTGGSLDVALERRHHRPDPCHREGRAAGAGPRDGQQACPTADWQAGLKSITDLKGNIISVGADNDITTVYFERMMAAQRIQEG